MPDTKSNLLNAFGGESKASRKYLAYADKAEDEGNYQIARLFRAASAAETIHALSHIRASETIGSTEENLLDAINGESDEFTNMYPEMIERAKSDGDLAAESSLQRACTVEKVHHAMYKQALSALKAGDIIHKKPVFVCQVCGNTVAGELPDSCSVCGVSKKNFTEIE